MLAAPVKKGKNVDWQAPLRSYLVRTYGEKTADEQTESLSKLNQTRDWVLSSKKGDNASLDNVKLYLRMLGTVEARFPIRETDVNMNFTWYDSFKPTKKFSHHRLEAERAAVLFNYAALESYAGMVQDRGEPEGLVTACEHFRSAARYFQYLRDVLIPEKMSGPVTSDLSFEGLSMLTNLMLAQAQACFFERAVKNKLNPSVLSKLAAGAKQLYANALASAQSVNLAAIIDQSWATHLAFQVQCFDASSEYQYSKVLLATAEKSGEGYGLRIAYMQAADQKCSNAVKTATENQLPNSMLATIGSLQTILQKDLRKAIEENTSIYMDLIPNQSTLTAVQPHLLAKSEVDKVDPALVGPILPGTEAVSANDIFKDLLPAEVQLAVALFRSRVSDMLEKVGKLVRENDQKIKSALVEANLPATIEAGDSSTRGVPDDTWSKILEVVHQKGGVMGLKAAIISNGKLTDQLAGIIKECQSKLKADEVADLKQRQVWGEKWTLPDALEAASFINKDCARFQGYLQEARESDNLLRQKIEDTALKTLLDDISMQKEGLDLLMPDPGIVDDDPVVENLRSNLRMSFIKLQGNLSEGTNKLEDLKYEAEKDSIVTELYVKDSSVAEIVNNEERLKSIIDRKLEKYEEPISEIEGVIENHNALLNRVLDDTAKYMASRRENKATREREAALARIEHGIEEFSKLSKHVDEGKNFYASLTTKVNRLLTLVNDHCLSRELLAKELEQNLIRSVEDNKFNTNSNHFQAPVTTPYANNQYPFTNPYNPFSAQPPTSYSYSNAGYGFPQNMPQPMQQPQYNPNAMQSQYKPNAMQPQYNPNSMQFQANAPTVQPPKPEYQIVNSSSYNPVSSPPQNTNGSNLTGKALMEQMRQVQLGTEFDDSKASSGPSAMPNGLDSDQALMQAEIIRQQEELLARIQVSNSAKDIQSKDYTREVEQMKMLLGTSYSDSVLLDYIRAADGNVEVAVNHALEGKQPNVKEEKKKGGFWGRGKAKNEVKKDKKKKETTNNHNYEW